MTEVRIAKELLIETPNEVGRLAEVTSRIAKEGINIEGINAYTLDNKAYFRLVVSDTERAKSALFGFKVDENEVVVIGLENKVGAAKEITLKLKEANINLSYVYGSTCMCNEESCKCFLIFSSNNNKKAVEIL
jgi:hypothetical protein